jgi:hypothetical protein
MTTETTTLPTGRFALWAEHFSAALRDALQWRLMLLWLAALALPVLIAGAPLWLALGEQLDHSLLGKKLVEGFDFAVFSEAMSALGRNGYSPASAIGGLVVFVLLLPWLTGIVMAAARAPQPLGFAALLKGGLTEYGRMARLWLWALVPLGLAAGAGGAALHGIKEYALTLTLEADADHLQQAVVALSALLFLIAHATVDAARAQLVLEPRRRSVVLAWWRATRQLLRRPGRILLYLAITAAGLIIAALLGWLRVQWPPVSTLSFSADLLLGQALVLALAWMRCARLFALIRSGKG